MEKYIMIGSGNMAWFLSRKLYRAGYSCIGVYGRNPIAVEELANYLRAPVIPDRDRVPYSADFCILAVPDETIYDLGSFLIFPKTVVIHTSGATKLRAIKSTHRAVLWPVYSIKRGRFPTERNIPVVWQANTRKSEKSVRLIAKTFSDLPFQGNDEDRAWLHLTAVLVNNFINHLMAVAYKICGDRELPYALLNAITEQTFRQKGMPLQNQTGPAIRHDEATLERHRELLEKYPFVREMYDIMSKSIQESPWAQVHTMEGKNYLL